MIGPLWRILHHPQPLLPPGGGGGPQIGEYSQSCFCHQIGHLSFIKQAAICQAVLFRTLRYKLHLLSFNVSFNVTYEIECSDSAYPGGNYSLLLEEFIGVSNETDEDGSEGDVSILRQSDGEEVHATEAVPAPEANPPPELRLNHWRRI